MEELKKQIVLQYSVNPIRNESYAKMINKKQFDATCNLISKPDLLFGGKANEKLLKIEPTLLSATFQSPAMQEEIFGPVLPIVTFKSLDEAIEKVNALSKPLALYIFSSCKKNQNKVLASCQFGGG